MPRSTGWAANRRASKPAGARRHLRDGALLLYDVTCTYLEGRCCELAQYGNSRDHRGDRPQLVIGLLCADDGCPVAVEVFEGNTGDPTTLHAQIARIKQRFRLQRVIMIGDRGQEPAAGGRAGVQARRTAGRHGGRVETHPGAGAAGEKSLAWRGRERSRPA